MAPANGLPSLSFAANICNNTVVAVHYTVIYEVPGDISRVSDPPLFPGLPFLYL